MEHSIDRDKVIKCLELCRTLTDSCEGCPYENVPPVKNCMLTMHDDALALLKQEAVKPVLDQQTGRLWLCGNCGSYVGFEDNDPHDPNEFDKYCRDCGTPVLWEGR